ncbi:histone H3/CENP-A, partial [Kipferlia bialata]|eukprot:g10984.t1
MARTKHLKSKQTSRGFASKVPRKSLKSVKNMGGPPSDPNRKKRRFRPGTVALRDIRRLQSSTEMLLPRAPFVRLVKSVINKYEPGFRLAGDAIDCLQEASEAYLCKLFNLSMLAAVHAKRVTLMS